MSKEDTIPSQKEIEKEISEYLSRKYGNRVKIIGLQDQQEQAGQPPAGGETVRDRCCHFDIKPEELTAYLDEYVIRQDQAKAVLATKICTHFNRIRRALAQDDEGRHAEGQIKNNVLLIGPTGVGKTYIIKLIARRLGVPFVKGDATKFSETGYVGGDVEDLVRDLVREADDDIESAQYGIIYIDEIDKIAATREHWGADVSRSGVQRALLKPMEETEVDLKVSHDPISQIEAIEHYRATGKRQRRTVNTANILFIMSGAFDGLEDIVKDRVQKQGIGFESSVTSKKDTGRFLKQVKAEDLIRFGFESEFVGRLPVLACLDELSVNDLFEILRNPNSSVVVGKKLDFLAYEIRLQFEDEALMEIARLAQLEQTGARGLVSVVEKILMPFEKKLPSTDVRYLAVTVELILNPEEELAALLADPERRRLHEDRYHTLAGAELARLKKLIRERHGEYLEAHGVLPTTERLKLLAGRCQQMILDVRDACDDMIEQMGYIRSCEEKMSAKAGQRITFSEGAVDRILMHRPHTAAGIEELCRSLFNVFEYGFGLLRQKKGLDRIVIPAEGVESPEDYINELVRRHFRNDPTVPEDVSADPGSGEKE